MHQSTRLAVASVRSALRLLWYCVLIRCAFVDSCTYVQVKMFCLHKTDVARYFDQTDAYLTARATCFKSLFRANYCALNSSTLTMAFAEHKKNYEVLIILKTVRVYNYIVTFLGVESGAGKEMPQMHSCGYDACGKRCTSPPSENPFTHA
jgi:hypothetical protein